MGNSIGNALDMIMVAELLSSQMESGDACFGNAGIRLKSDATYRDETLEIGKMLERTMMQKYGPAELKEHYMVMDTICDATQERQTAVYELVDKQPVRVCTFRPGCTCHSARTLMLFGGTVHNTKDIII